MTSLAIIPRPTQPDPQTQTQMFSFHMAVTGASIRLTATDYLAALPMLLATCNALSTERIELLSADADALDMHNFVAEHGVGALDQLRQYVTDPACEYQQVSELLQGFIGVFANMTECGQACLDAMDPSLHSAVAAHTDLFDFDGYAEQCERDGAIFTLQTADSILLFVTGL